MPPEPRHECTPIERMTREQSEIAEYVCWTLWSHFKEPILFCRMWRHDFTGNYYVEAAMGRSNYRAEDIEEAVNHLENILYGNSNDARADVKRIYTALDNKSMVMEIDIVWPKNTKDAYRAIKQVMHEAGIRITVH